MIYENFDMKDFDELNVILEIRITRTKKRIYVLP